jgi:hypothetical protein
MCYPDLRMFCDITLLRCSIESYQAQARCSIDSYQAQALHRVWRFIGCGGVAGVGVGFRFLSDHHNTDFLQFGIRLFGKNRDNCVPLAYRATLPNRAKPLAVKTHAVPDDEVTTLLAPVTVLIDRSLAVAGVAPTKHHSHRNTAVQAETIHWTKHVTTFTSSETMVNVVVS